MEKEKKGKHPEIKGLLILIFGLFLLCCLFSFHQGKPDQNWLGLIGYYTGLSLLYMLGFGAYLFTGWIVWIGWNFFHFEKKNRLGIKNLYFSFFLLSCCILFNVIAEQIFIENPLIISHIYSENHLNDFPFPHYVLRYNLGGVPLYYLYRDISTFNLEKLLSNRGIVLVFCTTALISLILMTNTCLFTFCKKCKMIGQEIKNFIKKLGKDLFRLKTKQELVLDLISDPIQEESPVPDNASLPPEQDQINLHISTAFDKKTVEEKKRDNKLYFCQGNYKNYRLPPLTLLSNDKKVISPTLKKDLRKQAEILEATLLSFGIQAKVGQIHCGPTITLFELHPAVGVKVQKIRVLENDIALNLQAKAIRIIAPIPGKAAVGVEIPSPQPQKVSFKEMLMEYQRKGKKNHIPILLGQTVTGENVICDLTKMPHLMIAGATGSGKSVCINSIVMSILMIASPDEIRLLLIDPKKVELNAYTNIPHMIAPVITEAHGAYAALNWLVQEMKYRYEVLKRLGLRNIHAFNNRRISPAKEEELGLEIPRKMSYLVCIIDEFADLMMASSSDLETPIARIAQMARAIGIHLILATQRPSREVITGLIKANFPSRIAFKVASRVNSQIILDENGAENLLGNGDLLFMPPGSSQLIRAQGVFVKDEDINRVLAYVEEQLPPKYLIRSFDRIANNDFSSGKEPKDDLYEEAYDIVVESGNASTTFLQRKLKIGYARAASLMDELEKRGIIGPQEGSRPRQILVKAKESRSR